ncbi:FecR family protein [Puia dinghuensis]|uniref:Iron dicitrate transporter FecR n=1 Tax=Puia dinghuensis TaxID=1792502 RepID=A0A8J2UCE7_9BACT|nr:FecR domain-containing protein [Puia dinghuensis]GGA97685.1 iron dicitrate transporter FecR [Puia dinghuensis]
MKPDQKFIELAEKLMNGTITAEEEHILGEWYNAAQDAEVVVPANFVSGEDAHRKRMLRRIYRRMTQHERRRIRKWAPALAAAVLGFAILGAIWWKGGRTAHPAVLEASAAPKDAVKSLADRATLTLADGSTVDLGAAKDGSTTANGKAVVDKKSAKLIYKSERSASTLPPTVYNTLATPRGGMYSIVLPDGTRAWLNASSSLRYPLAFHGPYREVSLTGEGYFEVAPNAAQPFKVLVNGMTVDVLGTHFDVMAYDDEPAVTTTLLEGSVKVGSAGGHLLLTPGQQSRMERSDGRLGSMRADVDVAIAWKNGIFRFRSEDIHSVMRKVARWYDVDIQYEGEIAEHFTGAVPRDADVSTLLRMMELTNAVKFQVEGRTIIVTP